MGDGGVIKGENNTGAFPRLTLDLQVTIDTLGALRHDVQSIVVMFGVVVLAGIDTNTIVFNQNMTITLWLRAQEDPDVLGLAVFADIIQCLLDDTQKFDFDTESLYDVLAREYKLVIHEILHTVSTTIADDIKAELLQIAEGDPLLVINTTAYLDNGEIIEYTTSYYRADRYAYSTKDQYTPC